MQAQHKGLKLIPKGSSDVEITTDYVRLCQILVTLVSNSLKFTQRGFICVEWNRTPEGVRIDVTDTGIGIN